MSTDNPPPKTLVERAIDRWLEESGGDIHADAMGLHRFITAEFAGQRKEVGLCAAARVAAIMSAIAAEDDSK